MNYQYIKVNGKTVRTEIKSVTQDPAKAVQSYRYVGLDILEGIDIPDNRKPGEFLKKIIAMLKKEDYDQYYDLLDTLTYRIITAKSVDDLISYDNNSLLSLFKENYMRKHGKDRYSKMIIDQMKAYQDNDALAYANSLFKEVVRKYIFEYLSHYTDEELLAIKDKIADGENVLKFVKIDDIPFIDIPDNKFKELTHDISLTQMERLDPAANKHLCFDCPVPIRECEKILNRYKETIDKYPFITDGIQKTHEEIATKDGDGLYKDEVYEETDLFLVLKCKKCENYRKGSKTK